MNLPARIEKFVKLELRGIANAIYLDRCCAPNYRAEPGQARAGNFLASSPNKARKYHQRDAASRTALHGDCCQPFA